MSLLPPVTVDLENGLMKLYWPFVLPEDWLATIIPVLKTVVPLALLAV